MGTSIPVCSQVWMRPVLTGRPRARNPERFAAPLTEGALSRFPGRFHRRCDSSHTEPFPPEPLSGAPSPGGGQFAGEGSLKFGLLQSRRARSKIEQIGGH